MPRDLNEEKAEVNALVRQLRPMLRGHHRAIQWAALAELVALWAIEHAAVRSVILEPLLNVHIKTIRNLVDGHIAKNENQT